MTEVNRLSHHCLFIFLFPFALGQFWFCKANAKNTHALHSPRENRISPRSLQTPRSSSNQVKRRTAVFFNGASRQTSKPGPGTVRVAVGKNNRRGGNCTARAQGKRCGGKWRNSYLSARWRLAA
jgi:hypothetical protein